MSESGNSSKLDVSSMLLMLMGMAAGRSLHTTPGVKDPPENQNQNPGTRHPPDVVVVHALEERVGLDLLHARGADAMLLLAAEPADTPPPIKTLHRYLNSWLKGCRFESSSCLRMRSLAFSEMGTSGGNVSVSLQFITFLYVS